MPENSPFSQRLLAWFEQYGRKDLPWQENPTAYRVWVSEIMLQQTQVNTVIPYYQRFMQAFPNVHSLATASLDQVLQLWTGLGYYARARNLHRSAQHIVQDFAGMLPQDLEALQNLPGIGRSTAGAILSLAYGQRQAILDGNVKRVLCRYQAIEGWPGKTEISKRLWTLAETLTPHNQVAEYTQAIMDLGATLCTRSRPTCALCPQQDFCQAHQAQQETHYPTPRPRKTLPEKHTYMLMLQNTNAEIFLQRRAENGIWGGLWSFPECDKESDIYPWCWEQLNLRVQDYQLWHSFRHTFSHYHLDIIPVHIQLPLGVQEAETSPSTRCWFNLQQNIPNGLPAPVVRLLDALK